MRQIRNPIAQKLARFMLLKADEISIKKQQDDLKQELSEHVKQYGFKDEKGSIFLDLPHEVHAGDKAASKMKLERHTSTVFDTDSAQKLLEQRGLYNAGIVQAFEERITALIDAFEQPVIITFAIDLDEDAVYAASMRNQITEEELDALYDVKATYHFRPIS